MASARRVVDEASAALCAIALLIFFTAAHASGSKRTASSVKNNAGVPDFQDKKKWMHVKDDVHTVRDEEGNAVTWGVTRFYARKQPDKNRAAPNFEMIVFLKGKEIPVYKQWGPAHHRLQAIPQEKGEHDPWVLPIPGWRNEHFFRVYRGKVINFVIMIYAGDAERPAAHFSLSDPPEIEEIPTPPSLSSKMRSL